MMVFGILLLFTYALSWLMAILGLLAKSIEAVQWMTLGIIFPLTFASSAFVPTEGMPGVLSAFTEHQPVTQVIDAMRALLIGTPIGNHGWLAVIWSAGILVVSIPLAGYLFRKYSSR
jgi:ABC-2 type transport system permease protein